MSNFNFKNFVEELLSNEEKLSSVVKEFIDDMKNHEFKADSPICQNCPSFVKCKTNNEIKDKINNSEYSDDVKEELIEFIDWIDHEDALIKQFNNKLILSKNSKDSIGITAFYKRFRDCDSHLDKLVAICDEQELSYIRKVIIILNNKIDKLLETIMNDNREEMNNLIKQLYKSQQETKSYEDMTREELLEELKKK